jgi:Predicted nucleic-acid-binding protein, contains PIN domain
MQILDTNMVLRYLLNDNREMADEAERVIKEGSVLLTIEVIAEVVYVLKGVYSIERGQIASCLLEFLSEVNILEEKVVRLGLEIYAEQNLDFVDCILYAYNRVKGYEVKTFDKKLLRLIGGYHK